MKKLFKKIKKYLKFKPHKTYTPILTLILSNRKEIESLKSQTQDNRYDLVPIYEDLKFDLYPMEFSDSRLERKRKLIKKKVGKYNFKILQGFWTFGIDFFDMEEYSEIIIARENKRPSKKNASNA